MVPSNAVPRDQRDRRQALGRRLVIIAGVLLFSILGFGLARLRHFNSSTRAIDSILFVPAASLNVGEVNGGRVTEWSIPVTNKAKSDVTISSFMISCPCVSISPKQVIISPGATREIGITLDLRGVAEPLSGKDSSAFSALVKPLLRNYRGPTATWRITGKVKPLFTISPPNLAFGGAYELPRAETSPALVRIKRESPTIAHVKAKVPPHFGTLVVRSSDEPTWDDILEFTPNPELPLGPFSSTIELLGLDANDTVVGSSEIPISGNVVANVVAVPSTIRLGAHKLAETIVADIVVQSRRTSPGSPLIAIRSVNTKGAESEARYPEGRLALTHTVHLATRILRRGNRLFVLDIEVETAGGDHYELPVSISYFGEDPSR